MGGRKAPFKLLKMKIVLFDSNGNNFATVYNFEKANEAAKAVFKRKHWSNLYYDIFFDNGTQTSGSIDLEPQSFHKPHQTNIFTWHLKTFWGNISRLKEPKFGLTVEDINYCKWMLTQLTIN